MPEKQQTSERKKPEKPRRPWLDVNWETLIWYVPLALLLLWLWQDYAAKSIVRTIPYSEFKKYLQAGQVVECEIHETEIVGKIDPKKAPATKAAPAAGPAASDQASDQEPAKRRSEENRHDPTREIGETTSNAKPFYFRTVRVEDPDLVKELEEHGVRFSGVHPGFMSQFLLYWALPLALMGLVWFGIARSVRTAGTAVMSFGRSRAKLVADKDTGVRFDDVAGCEEAKQELQEIVEFLKNPERFTRLGAKIPKGVLLCGPPGTGKTLLARAVAGEAGVPFFSISGSEFVEMFVGVGAARVRDLFQQAKQHAPCIIFIDELDAIGRQRSIYPGAANDEREQTLNQLLVELDGFEPNSGVVILAATNRPEILDRALLRPGRFDRQIVVDAPDVKGREEILRVHVRNKPLAPDVDLKKIAQATPGFSGADLANAVNEAALLAVRRGHKQITQQDLEDAVEKVIAGPERKSRRLREEERRRVAYHEVGHAIVAINSKHADPVHKISIVPRGRAALGYTLQLPTDDQFLLTKSELLDRIKVYLGGRAAEELVFGEVSSGAENDLERATAIARQMVAMYGMSDAVGLVHCARRESLFLPPMDGSTQPNCSEQTASLIDAEVKQILHNAYEEAKQIIKNEERKLHHVAQVLLEKETIDGETFRQLCQQI